MIVSQMNSYNGGVDFFFVILIVPITLLLILALIGKYLNMPKKRKAILRRCYFHIGQLRLGQMAIWVERDKCEICRKVFK